MPQTYKKPELPGHATVNTVVPKDLRAQELGPKTMVTCINRGSEPYIDKCDGRDYVVPPGLFEVEYEVADHFRLRSVVPGSRDPVSGAQDTFIAILGLDPPEKCVPFNQDEEAAFSASVEAIDRAVIEEEQGTKAVVVPTSRARARSAGQGHRRPQTQVQVNESQEAAPEGAAPAIGGDAARAGRGEDV